jgi:hypothetical protein
MVPNRTQLKASARSLSASRGVSLPGEFFFFRVLLRHLSSRQYTTSPPCAEFESYRKSVEAAKERKNAKKREEQELQGLLMNEADRKAKEKMCVPFVIVSHERSRTHSLVWISA